MFLEELKMTEHKEEEIFEMKQEYPYVIRRITPSPGRSLLVPWHWHQELEFITVKHGELEYITLDKRVSIRSGEGVFVNANVMHQLYTPTPAVAIKYDVHMFQKEFAAPSKSLIDMKYLAPLLQCEAVTLVHLSHDHPAQSRILCDLERLALWEKEEAFGYELRSRNLVSELMLELYDNQKEFIHQKQTGTYYSENRLKTMLVYIQEHYMDNISLADIAGAAHIGERECLRCFQKMLRITPFAYLQSYRVQVACGLLRFTKDSIMEIAMKTGFSSSSYFGKTFRKHMNCSPNEYRKPFAAGLAGS